jgi:hypothetical protein
MKSTRAWWITLGVLALLIALPMLLRKDTTQRPAPGTRRLVVFTPHSETIRREFSDNGSRSAWQQERINERLFNATVQGDLRAL